MPLQEEVDDVPSQGDVRDEVREVHEEHHEEAGLHGRSEGEQVRSLLPELARHATRVIPSIHTEATCCGSDGKCSLEHGRSWTAAEISVIEQAERTCIS
jgi:hypothetical protein